MPLKFSLPILVTALTVMGNGLVIDDTARAQDAKLTTVKLGGGSFVTGVGQANGFFAKQGLRVEMPRSARGGSEEVRRWLADGAVDVADYGVDNAIAMVEHAGVDVIVVAATDSTPVELMVQPEIKALAELRGRTVLVDAPNTQNALALKKLLSSAGLVAGVDYFMREAGGTGARVAAMLKQKDFAATMASGQTAVQARQGGLVSLATTADIFGPTLRYGIFTRRQWARDNSDRLVRFLAAQIEALRWILNPRNQEAVIDLIAKQAKLPRELAAHVHAMNSNPNGLAKDGAIDVARLVNVLRFRAEVEGSWGGKAPAPERYFDASYHAKALTLVNDGVTK